MSIQIPKELDLYSNYEVEVPQRRKATQKTPWDQLIKDLWISILKYLPGADLARFTSINRSFSTIQLLPKLWKNLVDLEENGSLVADLGRFAYQNRLSWKEVYRFRQLSTIFTKVIQRQDDDTLYKIITENNPEYGDLGTERSCIIRPLTRMNDQILTICDSYDVKIEKPGQDKPIILEGDAVPELRLIGLYADQGNLYVLRKNGTIAKWDLKNREQTATITSLFSENLIAQEETGETPILKQFLVQDGYIVLTYFKNNKPHVEIINANHPTRSFTIKDESLPLPNEIVIHEGKLYIQGTSGKSRESLIYIWDLFNSKCVSVIQIPTESPFGLSSMTIQNDLLCICDNETTANFRGPLIHLINTKTGKPLKKFNLHHRVDSLWDAVIIQNLLIAFAKVNDRHYNPKLDNFNFQEMGILIVDLNKEKLIAFTKTILGKDLNRFLSNSALSLLDFLRKNTNLS